MASLVNLFNSVLIAMEKAPGKSTGVMEAQSVVESYIHGLTEHNQAISRHLNRHLRAKDVVLTYSGSRTVWEALAGCWNQGKRFSVICSESRPACEGIPLARRLAAMGIPTSVTTDAMTLSLLCNDRSKSAKVTKVLVGADLITPQGFTNKAGTYPLAVIANHRSLPFYVLAGSEKFFSLKVPLERMIQDAPATELLPRPSRNLKAINRTFEVTPLSRVTGIFTEQGLLAPLEIRKHLKQVKIHHGIKATYGKIMLQR